ncbi:MAG: hypothetical protein IJ468_10465 [Lachnospiraceae bacterium]|nr:hypothetical protein [Lachnospiraceae bacterium]
MRKTTAMLAVLTLAVSLAACGRRGADDTTTDHTSMEETTRETTRESTGARETTKATVSESEKESMTGTFDSGTDEFTSDGFATDEYGNDRDRNETRTTYDGEETRTTDERHTSEGVLEEIGDDIRDGITGTETR